MNDKTNLGSNPAPTAEVVDENHIIAERREKLAKLREGGAAFPNDFVPTHLAADLHTHYDSLTKEELAAKKVHVKVAGRMVLKRVMGKASFATIQDRSGQIQFYISDELSGADTHGAFKHWDMGDFISAEGNLFKTNKGELSVESSNLRLLSKSLRPLPDKFHGLSDLETKYRQRYVDLIVNPESRNTFKARSNAIASLRRHMLDADFMEV
jgi:lysyl-tRNA synthetase class 2